MRGKIPKEVAKCPAVHNAPARVRHQLVEFRRFVRLASYKGKTGQPISPVAAFDRTLRQAAGTL